MTSNLKKRRRAIDDLIEIMRRLRSPGGCPWDREQNHRSLRWHAVEEVYELMDAIEADDDEAMTEELGDLLLQVVFHCQLGRERKAFDLDLVSRRIADKLVRRHPHVFGNMRVRNVEQVWSNWEKIKQEEKAGTRHARSSAFDGIPRHLPALMRAEKLIRKARKTGLDVTRQTPGTIRTTRSRVARDLFDVVRLCQRKGWSAEELLRGETRKREQQWRREEDRQSKAKVA